jgi:hypothetical protein
LQRNRSTNHHQRSKKVKPIKAKQSDGKKGLDSDCLAGVNYLFINEVSPEKSKAFKSDSADTLMGSHCSSNEGCILDHHSDQNISGVLEVSHISHAESDPDSAEAFHDQLFWAANLSDSNNLQSDEEDTPIDSVTPLKLQRSDPEFLKQIRNKLGDSDMSPPSLSVMDKKKNKIQNFKINVEQVDSIDEAAEQARMNRSDEAMHNFDSPDSLNIDQYSGKRKFSTSTAGGGGQPLIGTGKSTS